MRQWHAIVSKFIEDRRDNSGTGRYGLSRAQVIIYLREQDMSNKKAFWIAFIILSCCEFGQCAFSKNTSISVKASKSFSIGLHCYAEKALQSGHLFNGTSTRYLLPR